MGAHIPAEYTTQLDKADDLLAKQVPFSALASLGTILAALAQVPSDMREYLREQVTSRVRDADLGVVRILAAKNLDRLDRILRYGNVFQFEELVLALTIRIELALVQLCFEQVLQEHCVDSVEGCDDRLLEIKESSENRSAYRSAMRSIEKNWRAEIPLDPLTLRIAHLSSLN